MTQLTDLLRRPIAVAPMAGGPSAPDLVIAAAGAGALGFLAARGDTERMSLWAGQGYRAAAGQPAGEIIERLCGAPIR